MEAENYYWIESLRDVRLEDIRSQKSEICGLTSEVLSMKSPSLHSAFCLVVIKTGYFIIGEQGL